MDELNKKQKESVFKFIDKVRKNKTCQLKESVDYYLNILKNSKKIKKDIKNLKKMKANDFEKKSKEMWHDFYSSYANNDLDLQDHLTTVCISLENIIKINK